MKDKEKVKRGRKSRASGARFELKVRKDLESKGWVVDKWSNNVEFLEGTKKREFRDCINKIGEIIPAKHKFRGVGIPMAIGTGFPDFEARRKILIDFGYIPDEESVCTGMIGWEVIGVEAKINGILTKEEKEKYSWYLENNIFSKILIASRGEKRGTIKYKEFEKEVKGNDRKI